MSPTLFTTVNKLHVKLYNRFCSAGLQRGIPWARFPVSKVSLGKHLPANLFWVLPGDSPAAAKPCSKASPTTVIPAHRSALPEAPGRWKYTAGQELQCCLQKWEWQTFANSLPGSTEQLEKFRKSKTPRATEHKCSPFGSDANYWHLGGCLRKYHCMIIPILFPRYLLFTVSYNTLLFPSVPISLSYIESLVLNIHDSIHLTWVPFWHCNNQSPSSASQFQAERFWDDCGEIKHSKI